jgi:maltose alpha-D-glucosyltransferase/alpha-amylase
MTIRNDDALWYKDAIIYQVHVKSFYDTSGDGTGDFNGLATKLDYLESLGVTAIWLLPFYPSPMKDDGYDISAYFDVHPAYGTMNDFKRFLKEAHHRGIRVVTEMVLNHTSDQHEWFRLSRAAKPGSPWRDFYVWSTTNERYKDARIIFKDFETSNWAYDQTNGAYYWHRFFSHQPDLNYENPRVHQAMLDVIDFWMELGVDGMRLDAVPYLFEKEGTNCENLPQTYEFLRMVRAHVDKKYPGRMLLAEANQWPEDAAAYFGTGDICHMAFHFPLMPRMFMALQMEDRFPIVDILEQMPQIPDIAQWAVFLRNHDELTLEMVSDEERDYMYRAYALDPATRINLGIRRRLAPLLQNSRRRIELMNIMLFSMPGTPIIYYGDEIGMGDNHFLGDRNGVRTPMQWSGDRNAGFSTANPQRLFLPLIIDPQFHYETVNVENEDGNLSSLLWWMRRVIAMRRKYQAFSRGTMEIVRSDNASVLSFIRKYGTETILVVINLSRFSQSVKMDLRNYNGNTPCDVFSSNRFPRITDSSYVLTMGFHDYFWLQLRTEKTADLISETYKMPDLTVAETWLELFENPARDMLETHVLPAYLQQRTTAGCKPLPVSEAVIVDKITLKENGFASVIMIVRVHYANGERTMIVLPVSADSEETVNRIIGNDRGLIMAKLSGGIKGLLYDCAYHPQFHYHLLRISAGRRKVAGEYGAIAGDCRSALRLVRQKNTALPQPVSLIKAGPLNTSFSYDNRIRLKLYRRLAEGVNPDVELHRLLSSNAGTLPQVSEFLGALDYIRSDGAVYQLGMFSAFIHNTGTAWNMAVDAAALFLEERLASRAILSQPTSLFVVDGAINSEIPGIPGPIGRTAELLGTCTAGIHRALAALTDPATTIEPFTVFYQRSLYQSMRGQVRQVFSRVQSGLENIPPDTRYNLSLVLGSEKEIIAAYALLLKRKIQSMKIRIHGDLHLGKFIAVKNDFALRDFEGKTDAPMSERRLKRSSLRDAAGMINSFHWAAYYALLRQLRVQSKDLHTVEPWADVWADSMSQIFLKAYLTGMKDFSPSLVPDNADESTMLLTLFLIDRAIGEIGMRFVIGKENSIDIPVMALRKFIALANRLIEKTPGK